MRKLTIIFLVTLISIIVIALIYAFTLGALSMHAIGTGLLSIGFSIYLVGYFIRRSVIKRESKAENDEDEKQHEMPVSRRLLPILLSSLLCASAGFLMTSNSW